jgi:hypothetical protein
MAIILQEGPDHITGTGNYNLDPNTPANYVEMNKRLNGNGCLRLFKQSGLYQGSVTFPNATISSGVSKGRVGFWFMCDSPFSSPSASKSNGFRFRMGPSSGGRAEITMAVVSGGNMTISLSVFGDTGRQSLIQSSTILASQFVNNWIWFEIKWDITQSLCNIYLNNSPVTIASSSYLQDTFTSKNEINIAVTATTTTFETNIYLDNIIYTGDINTSIWTQRGYDRYQTTYSEPPTSGHNIKFWFSGDKDTYSNLLRCDNYGSNAKDYTNQTFIQYSSNSLAKDYVSSVINPNTGMSFIKGCSDSAASSLFFDTAIDVSNGFSIGYWARYDSASGGTNVPSVVLYFSDGGNVNNRWEIHRVGALQFLELTAYYEGTTNNWSLGQYSASTPFFIQLSVSQNGTFTYRKDGVIVVGPTSFGSEFLNLRHIRRVYTGFYASCYHQNIMISSSPDINFYETMRSGQRLCNLTGYPNSNVTISVDLNEKQIGAYDPTIIKETAEIRIFVDRKNITMETYNPVINIPSILSVVEPTTPAEGETVPGASYTTVYIPFDKPLSSYIDSVDVNGMTVQPDYDYGSYTLYFDWEVAYDETIVVTALRDYIYADDNSQLVSDYVFTFYGEATPTDFLYFVSSDPTNTEIDVPINKICTAEFDKNIDPTTLDGNVVLADFEYNQLECNVSLDFNIITIQPTNPFGYNSVYYIGFMTGLRSEEGYPLNEVCVIEFTTESGGQDVHLLVDSIANTQAQTFDASISKTVSATLSDKSVETYSCNVIIDEPSNYYYVSPTGDDGNPGTIDLPWRTPEHAFRTAIAGDTVYFREGTYTLTQTTDFGYVGHDGTPESPIIFSGYPGETATINCNALMSTGEVGPIYVRNKQFNYFVDLTFNNYKTGINFETATGGGVVNCTGSTTLKDYLGNNDAFVHVHTSDSIIVQNNTITGPGLTGLSGTFACIVLFGRCDMLSVVNNKCGNAPCGIYYKHGWPEPISYVEVEIAYNYIWSSNQNPCGGNMNYARIHDNIIGPACGMGGQTFCNDNGWIGGNYNEIYNNTICSATTTGYDSISLGIMYEGHETPPQMKGEWGQYNILHDNIFTKKVYYYVYAPNGTPLNIESDFNLFPIGTAVGFEGQQLSLAEWSGILGKDTQSLQGTALFEGNINVQNPLNFILQAGSPGKNRGSAGEDIGANCSLVGPQ